MSNPCTAAAQLLTSPPVTEDLTMTFISHSDVLGPSRITSKQLASSVVHSALEHMLCHIQLLRTRLLPRLFALLHSPSVTHPERVQKGTDLPLAFQRWESSMEESQRGRPGELDDDVKANAGRHVMPKEILDAVDLQPQYRTCSEIQDYMLRQARQEAEVFLGDVRHPTKKIGTVIPRVNTNTSATTKTTTPVTCEHEHEQSH